MLERLKADSSELIKLLQRQELVEHDQARADFLAQAGVLQAFGPGEQLVSFGEPTTDVFFLLTGEVRINVGKYVIQEGFPNGNHVGEMAALQVANRSATVTATTETVALKVTKESFKSFLDTFPQVYKALALDFARRIEARNSNINRPGKRQRIFAISSAEALPVAMTGVAQFKHEDNFEYLPWPAEVFRTSSYPMDDLEAELSRADFAVAIAQDDDMSTSRSTRTRVPRDNVIFELGLFMGRLGRKRTVLMVPKGTDVKLPSDLKGLSVVHYSKEILESPADALAAWLEVKNHFKSML